LALSRSWCDVAAKMDIEHIKVPPVRADDEARRLPGPEPPFGDTTALLDLVTQDGFAGEDSCHEFLQRLEHRLDGWMTRLEGRLEAWSLQQQRQVECVLRSTLQHEIAEGGRHAAQPPSHRVSAWARQSLPPRGMCTTKQETAVRGNLDSVVASM